jgi:hypothetical protein
MSELDVSKSTTTNTSSSVSDYSVDLKALDTTGYAQDETTWTFSEATQNYGYYKQIPELKKAIDALAIWTAGKGYDTDVGTQVILENLEGWGKDTFNSIIQNMIVVKKIIGDSFAEIVRNDKGSLINLKPISPERMRIIVGKNGIIKRYEQLTANGFKKFEPYEIFHLCNDRIGDEIHGTSVITACKWVIDARNEAMTDYRKVLHRNVVPVRIIEIDTDDTVKRNALITQYEEAIKMGEVLVIPKGTVEITETQIKIQDPIAWIQYLENFFYQAVGVPRVIATSENYSEASSKIGFLTFEPTYTNEQTLLEANLWSQLGLRLTFNRPPSLMNTLQSSEAKNTGQTNFQPKDMYSNMMRE